MKIADKDEFEKQNVFGTGTPNTAYAKYFIGESYLNSLTKPDDGLNLVAVTTGTFTTQRAAAVSSSSVQQARVGIRKRAKSL